MYSGYDQNLHIPPLRRVFTKIVAGQVFTYPDKRSPVFLALNRSWITVGKDVKGL